MAWSLRRNRPERVPETARSAIELGPGERLLSWACDDSSGATVVASNHRLYAVSAAGDIVLSGALGPMISVAAAARYRAHLTGLGDVTVEFA